MAEQNGEILRIFGVPYEMLITSFCNDSHKHNRFFQSARP